jgi:hypothetical protein
VHSSKHYVNETGRGKNISTAACHDKRKKGFMKIYHRYAKLYLADYLITILSRKVHITSTRRPAPSSKLDSGTDCDDYHVFHFVLPENRPDLNFK